MDLDPVILSRIQFALTIMFHYIFPPLTIGMGIVLVYLEGMYLWRREPIYETAAKFWTQLFAVNFGLGVATGIVMEFQFGTNWATYSRFVGDIFGSALAAEGIFAFFLESGFLAVLVFGWDKVSPLFHFIATLFVAAGSIFSSIWITVANSWQQTPAGYHVVQMVRDGKPWFVDGQPVMRAELVDFWTAVLNPSTIDRLVHVWFGAFLMGSFFILSISAYYILKGRHLDFARRSFTGALILATVFSCAQLISGHSNARMVALHQPAKMAAMEAHFKTGPADLSLFGLPDADTETTRFNIAIPGLLSFLIYNDTSHPVIGLDKIPKSDWPPLVIPFASYHIMIAIGTFFIALTLLASWFRWRGTLFSKRWLLKIFVGSVVLAVAANELGWAAAEVGRQPWTVYPPIERTSSGEFALTPDGMLKYDASVGLRTSQSVSESLKGPEVLASILMFSLIYILLFVLWIYVLDLKIKKGPLPARVLEHTTEEGFLAALSGRTEHASSMTEAKEWEPTRS